MGHTPCSGTLNNLTGKWIKFNTLQFLATNTKDHAFRKLLQE